MAETELDACLSSCCAKDRDEYLRYLKVKKELEKHDFVKNKVDTIKGIQQGVFVNNAAPSDVAGDGSDDEYDYLLEEVEEELGEAEGRRREAMERQAELYKMGYGRVQEMDEEAILKEVSREVHVPKVFLFGSTDGNVGHQHCMAMMKLAASKYMGTKFYSIEVSPASDVMQEMRIPSLPAMLAIRGGDVVSQYSNFTRAEEEGFLEVRILPWLDRCNVLLPAPPVGRVDPLLAARREKEQEELDVLYDCGKIDCRIRHAYAHQHVGSGEGAMEDYLERGL